MTQLNYQQILELINQFGELKSDLTIRQAYPSDLTSQMQIAFNGHIDAINQHLDKTIILFVINKLHHIFVIPSDNREVILNDLIHAYRDELIDIVNFTIQLEKLINDNIENFLDLTTEDYKQMWDENFIKIAKTSSNPMQVITPLVKQPYTTRLFSNLSQPSAPESLLQPDSRETPDDFEITNLIQQLSDKYNTLYLSECEATQERLSRPIATRRYPGLEQILQNPDAKKRVIEENKTTDAKVSTNALNLSLACRMADILNPRQKKSLLRLTRPYHFNDFKHPSKITLGKLLAILSCALNQSDNPQLIHDFKNLLNQVTPENELPISYIAYNKSNEFVKNIYNSLVILMAENLLEHENTAVENTEVELGRIQNTFFSINESSQKDPDEEISLNTNKNL